MVVDSTPTVAQTPPAPALFPPPLSPAVDDGALAIQAGNLRFAQSVLEDDTFQYSLLMGNNYNDDAYEAQQSQQHAAMAGNFMKLFWDSMQEMMQAGGREQLLAGEPVRFLARSRVGSQTIGLLDEVVLNPLRQPLSQKPVVQILLPRTNLVREVTDRINRLRGKSSLAEVPSDPADTHPSAHRILVFYTTATALTRMESLTTPHLTRPLDEEYTPGVKAEWLTDWADVHHRLDVLKTKIQPGHAGMLHQSMVQLGIGGLGLDPVGANQWAESMAPLLGLSRATLFPDLNIVALQPLDPAKLPTQYKGVDLTPAQQTDLLLGRSIELDGLRDAARPGLYRAKVVYNPLSQAITPPAHKTAREQVQTESPRQQQSHKKAVEGTDADSLKRSHSPYASLDETTGTRQRPGRS